MKKAKGRISGEKKIRGKMQLPKCDLCRQMVQLKDGVLSICFNEILEVEHIRKRWEEDHPDLILHVRDFLTYPDQADWKWQHSKCDVDSSYQIEAARLDNIEKVLHWTFHLMGKNWFQFTDWRKAILRLYPGIYGDL